MGYAVGITFRNVWPAEPKKYLQLDAPQYGKIFYFIKMKEPHARRINLAWKIIKRTILLFLIGLCLNLIGARFSFAKLRIPGVLQRIAICYFIVSVIYVCIPWTIGGIVVMLLLQIIYLSFMFGLYVPGCGRHVITPKCSAHGYIDRLIFGDHIYVKGGYDPEGVLSTLTAALTTYFGLYI